VRSADSRAAPLTGQLPTPLSHGEDAEGGRLNQRAAATATIHPEKHPDPVQTPPLPAGPLRLAEEVNWAHAGIRAIGERANATLKTWKILTELRCSPHRATPIVQAILVLHHVENPAYSG
jgi:hypothetical protein